MKIEDIIALTNAGWSKEEIIKMSELEQKEPEKKEPEQKEPEKKEPEQKEPEKKEPEQKEDKMAEILQRLEQISSGIQKGAIRDSQQPQRESVEDALAKIINPYIDKEENNNG